MRHWKRILKYVIINGLLLSVSAIVYAQAVIMPYASNIVAAKDTPTRAVALVFGGGMKPNGDMSDMQRDRVIRGIELYKAGKAKTLLMTGDDGGDHDDEVGAMKAYAIAHGVKEKDVFVDPHGYRTYDSCWRAKHVYRISEALVVSQIFHLPRILFLCNRMGVQTWGVSADLNDYKDLPFMRAQEVLARVKGVWDLSVRKPLPRVAS